MMLLALILTMATAFAVPQRSSNNPAVLDDHAVHSLSIPGIIKFRRAQPFVATSTPPKLVGGQGHLAMKRLPKHQTHRRPSAAAFLASIQRRESQVNVSAVDHFAIEYFVEVNLNGAPVSLIVDSSSADTWVFGSGFKCLNEGPNGTVTGLGCDIGPVYTQQLDTDATLQNQHFALIYPDGTGVAGPLKYADVEVGGVTVYRQEIAVASQGEWMGNNVTSGILGLAYPSLTSAYLGTNLSDSISSLEILYSPIFTSMITNGLVDSFWTLAINRNSSEGTLTLGAYPDMLNNKTKYHVETPLLIADLAHKSSTGSEPSYYTIVVQGISSNVGETTQEYPFIIDSGTELVYLPPVLADLVNSQFQPAATLLDYYHTGSYFTSCDAIPPKFGVVIEGIPFYISPKDMINQAMVDPLTGLCQTGIGSGGKEGPYILGLTFLTNVVAAFKVGLGTIEIYARLDY